MSGTPRRPDDHQMGCSLTGEATVAETVFSEAGRIACRLFLIAAVGASAAPANLAPDWLVRLPIGGSLSAGIAGIIVDAAGNTYVAGTSGLSSNTDITTAAYGPDG